MLQKSHIFKIIVYKYINMYIAYIAYIYVIYIYLILIFEITKAKSGVKNTNFNTKTNTYKIHF